MDAKKTRFTIVKLEERIAPAASLINVSNIKVDVRDVNVGVNAAVLSSGQQVLVQR